MVHRCFLPFFLLAFLNAGAVDLHIQVPSGGETYRVGEAPVFQFNGNANFASLTVELSRDAGAHWTPLGSIINGKGAGGDNKFPWTVTGPASGQCVLRMNGSGKGKKVYAVLSNVFAIMDQGNDGADGANGNNGSKGPKGDKGDSGMDGSMGGQGPKGDAGNNGKDGAQGPKGDKGDKGDAGPQGPSGGANAWGLTGNSNCCSNFLGTTDLNDLIICTNNAEAMRVTATTGNVGIGDANRGANKFSITACLGSCDVGTYQHVMQMEIHNGMGSRTGSTGEALAIGLLDNGNGVIQAKECNVGYHDLLLNPVAGNVVVGADPSETGINANAVFHVRANPWSLSASNNVTDLATFSFSGANVARIDTNGKGFFNGGTQAGGADVAEAVAVEGERKDFAPGDVLILSKTSPLHFEKSSQPYSRLVAGVYATKPGVLLTERDASKDDLKDLVPMGVVGIIPTKVCDENGEIEVGDLLVTSSKLGYAMKGLSQSILNGMVIGKAMQGFDKKTGMIKVLVNVK